MLLAEVVTTASSTLVAYVAAVVAADDTCHEGGLKADADERRRKAMESLMVEEYLAWKSRGYTVMCESFNIFVPNEMAEK